ncbi:unnamed protein product [Caenorhabditis brenneri]
MNADVENIKLKQIVEEFDDSVKVIKFHIKKKQSIEEKEPEGVRVVDEVKKISDRITVILKQLKKDVTGYNEMTADEVKLRLQAIIILFLSNEAYS